MASIFTYEVDLPRVSSPWSTPADSPRPASTPRLMAKANHPLLAFPSAADYGISRLEAEPQEGPTEYKLHLLLRPRRAYSSSSTGNHVSGSQQYKRQPTSQASASSAAPILAPSNQSRQKRFEQLTTQLLWRLQQSSPYHASSTSNLIVPMLPDMERDIAQHVRPNRLLTGLEESRGALYEIGVSDDGTLIGLTEDEMEESLQNLRAMAASLGCNVEVTRMVVVGRCEWQETTDGNPNIVDQTLRAHKADAGLHDHEQLSRNCQAALWVAEALVLPDLSLERSKTSSPSVVLDEKNTRLLQDLSPVDVQGRSQQLRVTLTGPTTSGKSSLLGTLSRATLDTGRGCSRIGILRHRHELISGVTSSVAQELIGYKGSQVINYAAGNVSTWTDVHAAAEGGRLVFVCDSAGHPKFRRTIMKGLIGWDPHWTLLCIGADDANNAPVSAGGTSSAQDILGLEGAGIDLAKAHLELCLKLDRPLAIIITKIDLATRDNLRQTVSKVISAIKSTGRTFSIIAAEPSSEDSLNKISIADEKKIRDLVQRMNSSGNNKSIIPIVMTSAAKGTGVQLLHALLANLPIPNAPTAHDFIGHTALNPEQPTSLFHIEDVFGVAASYQSLASGNLTDADSGSVVAGHLRFGSLSIGDNIVIGPFQANADKYSSPTSQSYNRSSPTSFGRSSSHPSTAELTRVASQNVSASVSRGEWHNARIVSIRNMRLPVVHLEAGQTGSVGFVLENPEISQQEGIAEKISACLRKGMVLAVPSSHMLYTGHNLQAASGFTASFEDSSINTITPGSLVVVYIASIRASAKVVSLRPHRPSSESKRAQALSQMSGQDEDVFGFDDEPFDSKSEMEELASYVSDAESLTDVTLELMKHREWIELGCQVLVMPGGGPGLSYGPERGKKGVAGLEGFVGKVTEVSD
ncbi:hypothetical protein BP5796_05997 [Coleophoma crateriformis]|uniref:Tr-type G domain-containing protein n=1 Tax=Coleophoma crateriformis TaxID=565419 RepID=A0A3D8RVW8_9HELO|nr:hypothetical protein BP5796_05997 [Coleophoma crateriformis]